MARSRLGAYFTGLSRDSVLLALASLFADISTEMLYPVLPIFLTQTLRASGSVVGLVEGAAVATQNIVQGFSGRLSDRLQKRKAVALTGYAIAAVAKPLIGLSVSWPGVLGARLLDRFGTGTRSAPRDALVASSVDPAHRGKAFGLEGFGDNLGAFVGPLLTVLLLIALQIEIHAIFLVAVIPGFLAFLMIAAVKERRVALHAKSKIDVSLKQFPKAYWRYVLATALFGLGNSSNSFLILRTQDAGVSLERTILIYAVYNLVAALISYPVGYLSDKWGRRNILVFSLAIFFVVYVGFALTLNIAAMALLFALYGVYQGIFRAVGKAFASDFVPERLRASGIGWYSTAVGLLGLMASVVAGLLWDRIGHSAVFVYGAAFALLGCIGFLFLVPSKADELALDPGR